jgi:hypothetical protein
VAVGVVVKVGVAVGIAVGVKVSVGVEVAIGVSVDAGAVSTFLASQPGSSSVKADNPTRMVKPFITGDSTRKGSLFREWLCVKLKRSLNRFSLNASLLRASSH